MPLVLGSGLDGATTVSGTMLLAARAGIQVFVTGGIGGVHRWAGVLYCTPCAKAHSIDVCLLHEKAGQQVVQTLELLIQRFKVIYATELVAVLAAAVLAYTKPVLP
jgi:hypothetical protein